MRKWMISALLVATLSTAALFAQGARGGKSLFDRLGGQPAVDAVASGLVDRILADNRVNKWFAHAASSPENTKAYKAKLASFICVSVGGPCQYTGMDMLAAHKGRGVTDEAFGAVAENLSKTLDQLKVPDAEKREVMTLIGSLKPSIVQTTAAGK
jgi:hemoglobin